MARCYLSTASVKKKKPLISYLLKLMFKHVIVIFFFLPCLQLAVLGPQPPKMADWSSTGSESNTNGHGSASTLPRMSSLSAANAQQGRQHTHQTTR